MTEKSKKYTKYTSPLGVVCGFTSLADPDYKYKKEGQYHTKLKFAAADVENYRVQAQEMAEAKYAEVIKTLEEKIAAEPKTSGKLKAKLKEVKAGKVVNPFKDVLDEESGEATGELMAGFKMTHKVPSKKKPGTTMTFTPSAFDSKGNKIALVNPWSGSKLKVRFEMAPYFSDKDNEAGVSFRLYAYQVIELVQGSGGNAESFGFGEEEGGYVASSDDEANPSTDEGEGGSTGADGADDVDF
jgi:hypothetical protein